MKYPRTKLKVWLKSGKVVHYPFSTRINHLYARVRHGLYTRIKILVEYGIAKDTYGNQAVLALQAFLE